MLKKGTFLILFVCYSILNSNGQLNNQHFYLSPSFNPDKQNDLYLSFYSFGFTKNNEYRNNIADGYTLFGFQINPELVFFPSENVGIYAGLYAWKDYGNTHYSEISPTFTVDITWRSLRFLFGTLDGSLEHQLIEPLYDFERIMTDRTENGIQAIVDHGRVYIEFWINWEKMLYRGDPFQEEMSGGLTGKFRIIEDGRFSMDIPIQIFGMHNGGQIDASPLPVKTIFNSAAGIGGQYNFTGSNYFRYLRTEDYLVLYNDLSFEKRDLFNNGNGVYLNLSLSTKLFDLMLSYWKGNSYISNYGGTLYNSRSTTYKYPDYVEKNRELLILRFVQNIRVIDNLYVTARIEPFYDFHRKKFEFSHGLYVNYIQTFFLKKAGNKSGRSP